MSITLYCNDPNKKGCHWSGDPQELVAKTTAIDDHEFKFCPNCEGNDFAEEEDDKD